MAQNRFLEKRWQTIHLKKIKERAGNRYAPKLNVDLPIAEIFDGISRTENFYIEIRSHYGKLNREFNRISSKCKNKKVQQAYNALKCEISYLSKILGGIKEYNTKDIPWSKVNRLTKKANDISWKLSEKLRDEKTKAEKEKPEEKQENRPSVSERISSDIHYLYETQKELRHFEDLSSSRKAKLSNNPFLFLTGVAGTGKTHLLCDVVENRITSKKSFPAVLVFGELFATTKNPLAQIIQQLGLQLNKKQVLRLLDNAGKKSGCRTLIVIDALNETRQRNFWKRNLNKVIDEVKKYPNVALVISVRSGFEDEVLTKRQRKVFIHEEHRGFQFREWEAVNKFFQEFRLPMPEIPLLMPEFQNPLFLLLFCKAFQDRARKNKAKKQRQIFRGHEGATYIFETFVDSVSKRLSKQFGISNSPTKNVWDTVIEKIAEKMVNQSDDRITEEKVVTIVKTAYPSIDYDHFIKELDRNLLLVKVPRYSIEKREYEGFDFRFSFQKFSDHLIGRYIFKKYEKEFGKSNKNLETAKKFFSKRRKFGKFLSKSWNRGIIEALSIQCPERLKGCELVDVASYLRDSHVAQEAFVESLIWRKPDAFSSDLKNTLAYINTEIIRTESGHNNLLGAFLSVAPIPKHPFNANFLHKHLSKFSMAKRDSWWSTFLHYQYGARGSVDRLIEWGWSEHDKTHINDESIRLCSVALVWFLTTPNRFIRDKNTKALVSLLTGRLNIVLVLLQQFKDVNDLYVSERLYAVAYGCALRNREDKEGLKNLAQWVYNNIFRDDSPPIHILWRDYARGIIEVALYREIKLNIEKDKICPPYKSKWPDNFPSNNKIKKYEFDYKNKNFKDYLWAQNSIIHSMQPEYSEIFMYGDFGRYVFQSALSHFNIEDKSITIQQLSNWAVEKVFDLGYNVQIHGEFDRRLDRYYNSGRSAHKAERIGKKYQWIAFHKLLAIVSDCCKFKEESWSNKFIPYKGPWQMWIRDIDPSCLLRNTGNSKKSNKKCWWFKIHHDAWATRLKDGEWLRNKKDLPNPSRLIQVRDKKRQEWLVLEGFFKWEQLNLPEEEKYEKPRRDLWFIIKSYLVKQKDIQKVYSWATKQNFMGRWMVESNEFYTVFLREFPWASSFESIYIPYRRHNEWTQGSKFNKNKIPAKVLVTDDEYLKEYNGFDCSVDDSIHIKLPAKWLYDKMGLRPTKDDGVYSDSKGKTIVFDPTVKEEGPQVLLINKKRFLQFLFKNGYEVFWTVLGEKGVVGGGVGVGYWPGRLEMSGAYKLNKKTKLMGKLNIKFNPPTNRKK